MLQFHTLVLLLDTQVYFGHTAVSHDGAAGSLNTLVLTAVSHDGAAVLFCMLQFHTLVLLQDTQVYFGHTAVSHDGAADSLNILWFSLQFHTMVLQFCFVLLTHWHCSQDTLVVQLYSLDMLVQLFLGYAGTVVL